MRRLIWTLIALAAVGVFLFAIVAPPAPETVDASAFADLAARTVPGAYHVHTTRSDGHGDRADVAAAAKRAGLKFVILTDHGDGTRPPDPPEYVDGVLMLDAVEISTNQGHYVALDMPRAPYPLGGTAASVVEDVARLGGFGIAAHPDSPKPALRWTDDRAPIDGIEWLSADSEWRDEPRRTLVRAGLAYFLRPGPALASLLDRPPTLARWDRHASGRRVVALAGVDAHGGVGTRAEDPNRTLYSAAGIPSYEASFRELSIRANLPAALSGQAATDARAVYDAIRRGNVLTAIDALASPGLLDFHAVPTGTTATLFARAPMPRGAEVVLLHDGEEIARAAGELRKEVSVTPGGFRVEVRVPRAPGNPPVPWLVSNALYLVAPQHQTPSTPAPSTEHEAPSTIAPFPWRIEKDEASSAILRTSATAAELEYKLAEGARNSQFVALATDVHDQPFSSIDLVLASDRPSRVFVQVRNGTGQRWGRSFYVDPADSAISARLTDLSPLEGSPEAPPTSTAVTSILLVIDLTNGHPGFSGRLTVRASALVK